MILSSLRVTGQLIYYILVFLFSLGTYNADDDLEENKHLFFSKILISDDEKVAKYIGDENKTSKISVIIPVYNEGESLRSTLECLYSGIRRCRSTVEVIISDGGSTDDSIEVAKRFYELIKAEGMQVKITQGGNNRSESQNLGATRATGEILLFLHADTLLPLAWDYAVCECLRDPNILIGAFEFGTISAVDSRWWVPLAIWFLTVGTNLRSHYRALPYGDQGFFLRKPAFARLGTFPSTPFMEDYDLVVKARKLGGHRAIKTLEKLSIKTSIRRWLALGCFWTTAMNQIVLTGNAVGI